MIDNEIELIEKITGLISSHLKDDSKYKNSWFRILKEINKLMDYVVLDVVQENRNYEQVLFEQRLKKLNIHIKENIKVSIATYEKLNEYLNLYENLRLTKDQVIILIERDLEIINKHERLTTDEIRRLQIEMQVKEQKKRKGNKNGS